MKESAKSPTPPPIVELIDPARIEEEVWNAGVDEWVREGNEPVTIPLDPRKWEALLRRRRSRLAAEQYEQAKEAQRRERTINSLLRPPKPSDVALDGKSVCDVQSAYNKGREEFSEAWNSKYQELPDAVSMAWDLYHDAEGDSEMRLRDRTPTVHDLPDDLTEVENG